MSATTTQTGAQALAYTVPAPPCPVDLRLDANEGRWPNADAAIDATLAAAIGRYPDDLPLRRALAERFGVEVGEIAVTAGADDALDRIVRLRATPTSNVVLPEPTFVMLRRYAREVGASIRSIDWPDGPYPIDEVIAAVDAETAITFVVSPNNPTGAVATAADLKRLAVAAPHATIVVDLAYAEFADEDLTATALALPNAIVVRTFSKAWGLAGCRVGFAIGRPETIAALRSMGPPYATSSLSLALAARRLADEPSMRAHVDMVSTERARLCELLADCGIPAAPGEANFVLARTPRAAFVHAALAGLGIAVRRFAGEDHPSLRDALRITCPGDAALFARLERALLTVLQPEAILFDMDGVLADVRGSYRAAIVGTAAAFGVNVTDAEIHARKNRGDANDDWELTRGLLADAGVEVPIEEVREAFERLYQGTDATPGLWTTETLAMERTALEALARRMPIAVVTGRPRADAEKFLATFGLEGLFATVVAREDTERLKPSPEPVSLALRHLGVDRGWMIGDTPDDVVAARAAGVLPVGCLPPGAAADAASADDLRSALFASGAGLVLDSPDRFTELLR